MYATEYAKQSGHSYNLILRLLGEGKIPAIKGFKYDIDPDEADAAIAALKIAPKRAPRRKEANKGLAVLRSSKKSHWRGRGIHA